MLVKCRECQYEIKNKADKCSNCGAKLKKSGGIGLGAALVAIFLAVGFLLFSEFFSHHEDQSAAIEKQASLKSLIQGYIADGILLKVEEASSQPAVYITALFGSLTTDEKNSILSVVLTYYQTIDPTVRVVRLYDSRIGKSVAQYDGKQISTDGNP